MPDSVHDPKVLRAIAHPIRNRILGELTAAGPLRAADVAAALNVPANTASFHLRQLAKYGLVEEAPDAARDRRDRVWRAVNEDGLTIDLGTLRELPGGEAASEVFLRNAAAWGHAVVDAAYAPDRTPGRRRSTTEQAVRLTQEEAAAMGEEIAAVVERWVGRTRGADGERETYLFMSMLLPHPGSGAAAQ